MEEVQKSEFHYPTSVIGFLLKVFISYLHEDINGIIIRFAEDKMLQGLVILLEKRIRIPEDFDG